MSSTNAFGIVLCFCIGVFLLILILQDWYDQRENAPTELDQFWEGYTRSEREAAYRELER